MTIFKILTATLTALAITYSTGSLLAVEQPTFYWLDISVSPSKPSGDWWDDFSALSPGQYNSKNNPDIMVTLIHPAHTPEVLPICRDKLSCRLYVKIYSSTVNVNIKDRDLAFHDSIGSGVCRPSSGTCVLGSATLTWEKARRP